MIVTDYDGNIIEFTGSKQDALATGYNVDCINCKQCRSCSNCSYCSFCSNCSFCSFCSYCSNCSFCSNCSYCSDCSRCSRCSRCSNCSRCSRCSRCSDCSECSECSRCSSQPILNTPTSYWTICLRQDHTMKIGCQEHTISDWLSFTDEKISGMSSNALSWWKQWKPIIEAVVAQLPKK